MATALLVAKKRAIADSLSPPAVHPYSYMMSAMAWSVSYCISPILKRRRRSWTSSYIESHSDMTKMMKQSC